VIEKERPLIIAGGPTAKYRVFVDGQLIHEQSGLLAQGLSIATRKGFLSPRLAEGTLVFAGL